MSHLAGTATWALPATCSGTSHLQPPWPVDNTVVTKTVINIIPLPWQLLTAAYHAVSTNEAYIICNSTLSVQMMLTRTNYFSRPFLSAAVIDHHANQTITRIFSPAVKSNISPSQCFGDLLKLFLHPW